MLYNTKRSVEACRNTTDKKKFTIESWRKKIEQTKQKTTRRERPKSAPYLRLKNIQGTTIGKIWKKKFFQKKILIFFRKKKYFLGRTMPKNSKRGHSGSFNVFYKPKTGR